MTKLLKFICSIALLLFGIAYINLNIFKSSMRDVTSFVTDTSYVESFKEITRFEPIYEIVPVEHREKVEVIIDKVTNDAQIQEIVTEQTSKTIDDILNDTNSFDQNQFTNDLFLVFDDYADEFEAATDKTVPKEIIRVEFEKQLKGYDLSTHYERVVKKAQSKITDKQKAYLSMIKNFIDNIDMYINVSLIGLGISTVLLGILSVKSLFVVSIIAAIIVLLNRLLLPTIFTMMMNRLIGQSLTITMNESIFVKAYIYLMVMFAIGLGAKVIDNRRIKE